MATQFDLKEFEVHLQVALALPAAKRWSLERDTSVPLGVFCVLQPRTAPQESFKARLRWDDYSKPHSLKFVNMENGSDRHRFEVGYAEARAIVGASPK